VGQIAHSSPRRRIALFHNAPLSILVLEKKNPQATERRSPAGVPRLRFMAATSAAVFSYLSFWALILVHQGSKIIECGIFIIFLFFEKYFLATVPFY
jgi:hypothetical protein